ncbi:MAG: DNA polymerase [Coprococcus sp.]
MALFTADFETTTDPTDCRVWACGICEIGNPDNFTYMNDIDGFIEWTRKQRKITTYFHNLKFDGEFILCWLFENGFKFVADRRDLEKNTFTTLISDKGQFYSMEICFERKGKEKDCLTIYDSLKILPFSVAAIAKGFNLPISKLEIDYNETREKGHILTKEEVDYLRNDVEIMARALHILFEQGLTKMTQGSNALYDYKRTVGTKNFSKWFPIPEYDSDIRQSYKGGFTYLNPKYKEIDLKEGIVLDVNSLYPSVMYYQPLPYGEGIFFKGKYELDKIYNLHVQMFTCQFELKPGYIPTIQLKNNLAFVPTQYLESSDGEDVTLCLTNVDMELFFDHYVVYNIEWHSGWKFKSTVGLFKEYIDKWNKVKMESTINGNKAMRTLAKLMLNALYGKFALNPNVQSKIPWYDNGVVKYKLGEKESRDPIYIPVGTFITAWARYKTISSAQKVYDRFVYADTDSLHLIGTDIPDMLEVDPVKLGAWKHESTFTRARFIRQKSYIEEIDGELNITCAGMPERCYQYVTWDNFHTGTSYDGKLGMTHVNGGIVLKDIPFSIKSA